MPKKITVSTSLPPKLIQALDAQGKSVRRSRSYLLEEIAKKALARATGDKLYPPVGSDGESEGGEPVTFASVKGLAENLTTVAKKRDWSRAKLLRNMVQDAVGAAWLKDIK